MNMTIEQLYLKLCSKEFQDAENGDLFYNFFVYQYPANQEYEMESQIHDFKAKLLRPINYVDVLTLNLFDEFCHFLDGLSFGKKHPSYLKYLLQKDGISPDSVNKSLSNKANCDAFYKYIHQRIMEHVSKKDEYIHPYVFLYGIGKIFPYLRTNVFLTNYEQYNKSNKYKIIVFYPGHRANNTFNLFGKLDDDHTYRATLLINE